MNAPEIKISSNWTHLGGCSLSNCVQELAADPDIFIKPDVNKLVDENKSILLVKVDSSQYCELYVNKFPQYKIQAVSFVCNVAKVEIFEGPIMEYMETIYGVIVDETDDQFKSYRYDIEIEKSGVTDLTLKFLTKSSEVCIFGLMLHTAPNPRGITSLLPFSPRFNNQNGLEVESKSNALSKIIETPLELPSNACHRRPLLLDQHFKEKFNITIDDESRGTSRKLNEDVFNNLKLHIDRRCEEISKHVDIKLAEMEERQNKQFEKLLHILENNK